MLLPVTVAAQPPAGGPTFSHDIAPLILEKCSGCHRDGGDAPFGLDSYEDIRRRAATIRAVVSRRYMPPWKPVAGEFVGDRRLSDRQLRLLVDWIDAGAPLGQGDTRPQVPPTAPVSPEPDLVLRLPEYTLRADGPDVFRNFVLPVPLTNSRFVRGLRFTSGSTAVHHANIRIDPTAASYAADQADPSPGYEGVVLRSADFPDGHFLGWTPGQVEPVLDDDTAWRLERGSFLVIQLHLRPTGRVERLAPTVGLYFGDRASQRPPTMIRLGRQSLSIPAGSPRHVVVDTFVLPVAADVRAVQPHAHYRARSLRASARAPDGSERLLIRIDDWDVNWQDRYVYREPLPLPAGTTIRLEFTFDNSSANVRNPVVPPARAVWGWRSSDEMADLWIQVQARSEADRQRLETSARAKMQAEDVIGGEQLLAREPDHVDLHNDVALTYMALGRPRQALAHFRDVSRLRPGTAQASFNEGVALEALGEDARAASRYGDAIASRADYAPAHNNLGALLLRTGRAAAARSHFERALASEPQHVDARANLATTLLALGAVTEAVTHIDAVADSAPERLRALSPLLIWLAASPDASKRRPTDARRLAERLVTGLATPDALALDTFAIALAANGEFEAAIARTEAALRTLPATAGERSQMLLRLQSYRRGRPFVLPAIP